jgi:hypothetical protein
MAPDFLPPDPARSHTAPPRLAFAPANPAPAPADGRHTCRSPVVPMRTGVYVDAENATWLSAAHLAELMKRLRADGFVSPLRACGDWIGLQAKRAQVFDAEGFVSTQVRSPKGGRNGADIQLVVHVLDDIARNPWLRRVVIVSADSDFAPLLRHLADQDIETVCVGPPSALALAERGRSRTHWTLDDLLPREPQVPGPHRDSSEGESESERFLKFRRALRVSMARLDGDVLLPWLKDALLAELPGFDQRQYGHQKLSSLLRDHTDLVELASVEHKNGGGGKAWVARRPT